MITFQDFLPFTNQRNPVKTMAYDLSPVTLADVKTIIIHQWQVIEK